MENDQHKNHNGGGVGYGVQGGVAPVIAQGGKTSLGLSDFTQKQVEILKWLGAQLKALGPITSDQKAAEYRRIYAEYLDKKKEMGDGQGSKAFRAVCKELKISC